MTNKDGKIKDEIKKKIQQHKPRAKASAANMAKKIEKSRDTAKA